MDEEEHDASSMLIHMAVEAWDVHNIFMPFNLWIMLTDGTSGLENLHMIERERESIQLQIWWLCVHVKNVGSSAF